MPNCRGVLHKPIPPPNKKDEIVIGITHQTPNLEKTSDHKA